MDAMYLEATLARWIERCKQESVTVDSFADAATVARLAVGVRWRNLHLHDATITADRWAEIASVLGATELEIRQMNMAAVHSVDGSGVVTLTTTLTNARHAASLLTGPTGPTAEGGQLIGAPSPA